MANVEQPSPSQVELAGNMPAESILPECYNETNTLSSVIIGFADNLYLNRKPGEPIAVNNLTQAKNQAAGNEPKREVSMVEVRELEDIMAAEGISVFSPVALSSETGVTNQMYSRDIGFVVGNTFFVSSMSRPNRRREAEGISHVIEKIPKDRVEHVPMDLVLEGGDVVVGNGNVFVGISQRTTQAGAEYLASVVSGMGLNVVPIPLLSIKENTDVLHLDCAFMPVGEHAALIFKQGMRHIPEEISDVYDLIEVTAEEQADLATNVLAISATKVIARHSATRVNNLMRDNGIEVIDVKFDEAPRAGGSIRCCTLPLVRVSLPI